MQGKKIKTEQIFHEKKKGLENVCVLKTSFLLQRVIANCLLLGHRFEKIALQCYEEKSYA